MEKPRTKRKILTINHIPAVQLHKIHHTQPAGLKTQEQYPAQQPTFLAYLIYYMLYILITIRCCKQTTFSCMNHSKQQKPDYLMYIVIMFCMLQREQHVQYSKINKFVLSRLANLAGWATNCSMKLTPHPEAIFIICFSSTYSHSIKMHSYDHTGTPFIVVLLVWKVMGKIILVCRKRNVQCSQSKKDLLIM